MRIVICIDKDLMFNPSLSRLPIYGQTVELKQDELLLINHVFSSDLISKKLKVFFRNVHVR